MSYCRIVRAIRRFCLDCQGGAAREVRICTDLDCALRVWRMAGARVGELAMDASDARPPGHDALSASCGVPALPTPGDTMQATMPEAVPQTPCTPTGPLQTGGTEDMAAGKASFRCASPVDGAASPSLDRNGDRAGFPAECVPPGNEGEAVPPLRAIRRFCLHCCGFRDAVRGCDARETCALWSYRFGVQPETYRRVRSRFSGPRTLVLPGFSVGRRT